MDRRLFWHFVRGMQIGAWIDVNLGAPDKDDLLQLAYSLDGEPFINSVARGGDETLTLAYSLDGEPFLGVSA